MKLPADKLSVAQEQSADKSQAPSDALSNTRAVQRSEQHNDRTGGKEQKRGARGFLHWGQPIQRSLLPKDWSTQHEVSWSWLWENVERIMNSTMGKPGKWEGDREKAMGRGRGGEALIFLGRM